MTATLRCSQLYHRVPVKGPRQPRGCDHLRGVDFKAPLAQRRAEWCPDSIPVDARSLASMVSAAYTRAS
jgi:hypothetical protein